MVFCCIYGFAGVCQVLFGLGLVLGRVPVPRHYLIVFQRCLDGFNGAFSWVLLRPLNRQEVVSVVRRFSNVSESSLYQGIQLGVF